MLSRRIAAQRFVIHHLVGIQSIARPHGLGIVNYHVGNAFAHGVNFYYMINQLQSVQIAGHNYNFGLGIFLCKFMAKVPKQSSASNPCFSKIGIFKARTTSLTRGI